MVPLQIQNSGIHKSGKLHQKSKNTPMKVLILSYFKSSPPRIGDDVHAFLTKNRGSAKVIILQQDPKSESSHAKQKKSHRRDNRFRHVFQGRSLCSRMLHDAQNARRLEGSGHKDFYRIVLYEHFLKNPENILKGYSVIHRHRFRQ
ncbi:uncharacterized protein CEXT_375271 [Caerostris extrusa]|uniref:Uncharacterized protein n=1 Tax=Caerostris extrusa TaxID=172846 RepID=A0AAV4R3E7_CAEEX|nr:uncharacterized protein CEXT_375271 [Caerostris extrusa]